MPKVFDGWKWAKKRQGTDGESRVMGGVETGSRLIKAKTRQKRQRESGRKSGNAIPHVKRLLGENLRDQKERGG